MFHEPRETAKPTKMITDPNIWHEIEMKNVTSFSFLTPEVSTVQSCPGLVITENIFYCFQGEFLSPILTD